MSTKVGVVVRTKDRTLLLERALGSIRDQVFTDWQVLLVNDSPDAEPVSRALAATGLAGDPRVRVVQNQVSQGRSAAINTGLEAAAAAGAELVALHDDDDSWHPEFLAQAVAHLDAHPGDVAVAVRTEVVFETVGPDGITEDSREVLAAEMQDASLIATTWSNFIPPISLLFRRSAQEQIGLVDLTLPVLEDWDFLLRLMILGPVGFLPATPLAYWHQRPGSASGPDSNSIVAEADDHRHFELVVRDRYLRRDLSVTEGEVPTGLGTQLALARQLKLMSDRAEEAWQHADDHLVQWGSGNQELVKVTTLELGLEIGRLRGEVLTLRNSVQKLTELVEALTGQVETSTERSDKVVKATMRALTEAAERPGRPVREALVNVSDQVSGALRRSTKSGRGPS